jgi:hypothetical protein
MLHRDGETLKRPHYVTFGSIPPPLTALSVHFLALLFVFVASVYRVRKLTGWGEGGSQIRRGDSKEKLGSLSLYNIL